MVSSQSSPCLLEKYNSTTTAHEIYGQDQLRFKRYLTIVAIFEMSQAQLPAFHFEIGVPFFEYYYFVDSKWKQTNLYYRFLTQFFPVFLFMSLGDLSKIFLRGHKKRILGKKPMNRDIKRKTENFTYGFLPRN